MEPLILIILILAIAVIALSIFVILLNKRITKITGGSNAHDLESIIIENNILVKKTKDQLHNQSVRIDEIKADALSNIQNIGVIRFNPFKETGGNQSFAIALTDKEQNGVVISSLYARERVSVFAKPIVKGESEYKLTNEEKEAINQSQK
ncbi:MAG: hypothetical protein ACI870_000346 [Crocinitomicaceae bacterium]|jgi:hypothetical protein